MSLFDGGGILCVLLPDDRPVNGTEVVAANDWNVAE
jgi:hypothetical protein